MPPKPSFTTTTSREGDDAVQALTEKLGTLQTQLLDLQTQQDSRHESLHTMLQTLVEQISNLQHPQPNHTLPPHISPSEPILPYPQRFGPFPSSGPP